MIQLLWFYHVLRHSNSADWTEKQPRRALERAKILYHRSRVSHTAPRLSLQVSATNV